MTVRDPSLALRCNGARIDLEPPARRDGAGVWVPLDTFADRVGATVKDVDGRRAVCDDDGDVCVLLSDDDLRRDDGVDLARLDAFAGALGLSWSVSEDGVLAVSRGAAASTGIGVGDRPPAFALPDVDSGELVSADVVVGKPAVFYMWASW